jgi:hypothetical protein
MKPDLNSLDEITMEEDLNGISQFFTVGKKSSG